MAAIVDHTGAMTLGQVIDLIAPKMAAPERKALETRLGRWTRTGVFRTVGGKISTGRGRYRLYALREVVLMAIAQRLSLLELHIDAIENITVALRSRLEHTAGDNVIDYALDWIAQGDPQTREARVQDEHCLMGFARVGATDLWHPIAPKQVGTSIAISELAEHGDGIFLNLRQILACLKPALSDDAWSPPTTRLRSRK